MREQGPLRACQACPAAAPLGLSPSRCLSLPDTQQQPLCCFLKTKLSSQTRKKNTTWHLKNVSWEWLAERGTTFHPVPLIYQHPLAHTPYQKHTPGPQLTPLCSLLGSPALTQLMVPGNHKHFYLSGTKL